MVKSSISINRITFPQKTFLKDKCLYWRRKKENASVTDALFIFRRDYIKPNNSTVAVLNWNDGNPVKGGAKM